MMMTMAMIMSAVTMVMPMIMIMMRMVMIVMAMRTFFGCDFFFRDFLELIFLKYKLCHLLLKKLDFLIKQLVLGGQSLIFLFQVGILVCRRLIRFLHLLFWDYEQLGKYFKYKLQSNYKLVKLKRWHILLFLFLLLQWFQAFINFNHIKFASNLFQVTLNKNFKNPIPITFNQPINRVMSISQYSHLKKQLEDQHKRLLRQRQGMLQKQNDRLQLYQKIDLVEFFQYEPSESQSSKKEMMYHLTSKFKQYMRRLTQNNVYKKTGYQISEKRPRIISHSKSKDKSNVEKNSQLGRTFQIQRLHQNQHFLSSPPKNQFDQHTDKKNLKFINDNQVWPNCQSRGKYLMENKRILFEQNAFAKDNSQFLKESYKQIDRQPENIRDKKETKSNSQSTIVMSIQQLSQALQQQQKIYLLTELNYYIKLYKESEIKRQFMQKHLENLHEFVVDVRLKQQPKVGEKLKQLIKNKSNSTLVEENQMLRRQVQIYKKQIKALNNIQKQDYFEQLSQRNRSLSKSKDKKCLQVIKIDRFKQFADHIQIMQRQLSELIQKVNYQQKYKFSSLNQDSVELLQSEIIRLQRFIEKENQKKQLFFEEVKKFKQMMNSKDVQIQLLNEEIKNLRQRIDIKNQIMSQNVQKVSRVIDYNDNPRSKSKSNYLNQRTNQVVQNEIQLFAKKHQIGRFIDSALDHSVNQCSQKSFRYSRVTTKQPSQTGLRQQPIQYDNQISKQDTGNKVAYHSRMVQNDKDIFQKQKNTLNQRKRSSSRLSSKSKFIDSYEPRPYERYNQQQSYQSNRKKPVNYQGDYKQLYQRITQGPRDYSKSYHKTSA